MSEMLWDCGLFCFECECVKVRENAHDSSTCR